MLKSNLESAHYKYRNMYFLIASDQLQNAVIDTHIFTRIIMTNG